MKKFYSFLIAALALLVFMTPSLAGWGQTRTAISYTFSDHYSSNTVIDDDEISFDDAITATFHKRSGGTATQYYTNGSAVRWYGGGTLDIVATNATMSSITLTFGSGDGSNAITTNVGSYENGVWTGSASSVTFTQAGTSGNRRISAITVTYTTSGGGTQTETHTLTFSADPAAGGSVTVGTSTSGSIELEEDDEVSIVATPAEVGYAFSNWTLNPTTTGAVLGNAYNASTTFTMGEDDVELIAHFSTVTTYTVTYHANVTGTADIEETFNAGANVTVAANTFSNPGYAFTKWTTNENGTGTEYTPGDVINNIQANIDLYAQWEESSETTVALNIQSYGTAQNWENGTKHTSITMNGVTFTASDGTNTGTYYNNVTPHQWRFYQSESATITISVPDGNHLVSITPTYASQNTGVLLNGSTQLTSGNAVSVSGTSVTFSVGNSGTATNGQVRFTNIDVTYASEGGSQTTSDLAITNTSTALSFDLYNDITAQVINYTTSSTGAITITPETSTYFSYVHDADNKTITVTPLAVTPSAQTVTISQEADDDYYAGEVSFTVSVANSAPLANIAALTALTTAGNYNVALDNAVVTYVNGSNAYIQDASGAVLLYHCNDNNLNLAVGDKITGTANVTYTVYNNLPEVTGFTLEPGYTLTSGNTVTPAVVTIADLKSNYTSYISRYVKIENATVTSAFSNKNCTIEQNSSSIVLRDQNTNATLTTNVDDVVTVTAHPSIYNTTYQIAVYEQSQIVVAKVDPTITFNNGEVRVGQTLDLSTLFNSNSTGAVTYSITTGGSYATLTGSELTGTAEGSVTVKAAQAETTSYNAGEATATITVNPALVLSSIAVTTPPTKTTYNEGETFDPTGMVVTATYTDNSTEAVTGYTYSPDGALNVTHTYVTISYTENNVTKTTAQAITVNEVVDYAKLPFEWDDFSSTPTGITNYSVGSYTSSPYFLKFDGTGDYIILKFNETPGTLTFDIYGNSFSGGTFKVQTSVDGQTYTDLTSYSSLNSTTQSESFNNLGENVRYIKWIYTNKSSGNVALGNIALAAYVAPGNSAPVWSELPTPTIAVNAEYELDLSTYVTGTPTPAITLSTSVSTSLYEFENGLFMFQPTAAGTYQFTFTATNSEGTADATLTVTAAEVATYTLATSITSGRHYVIAASTSNVTKAMGGKNASKNYYDAIDASLNGNKITVMPNSGIQEFVIVGPNVDGYYYIYDPVAGGYLYASSSSSNDLSYQKPNDDNGLWEIDFTENTVTAKGTNTHNLLRYNSGDPRFSCYTSGQTAIAFYEKNESDPQYDFYVDIAAWKVTQNSDTQKTDGWYFIASPLESDFALTGTGMVSGSSTDYDLYRLNNTTWENYNNNHSDFTALKNGTGYLYANKSDITLHFSGAINEFTTDNNANVKSLTEGWNLIGNPYNIPIFINKPYYRMNANGDDIETEDGITSKAIPACTGVVVKATDGESVTFSTSAPSNSTGNNGNIQIALAQNVVTRGGNNATTIDNAIVSFNEGSQLQKFYFGTQNANIYIPMGAEEYAIVSAEAQGEMPVNFKANENGQYTLSVNAEEVEMNYLHLIDNMTGADIDLLNTPSYTFDARTTDYTSRFRLVFSANGMNSENDNFAFISNGQIILTEQGTVQVFDITGRMISSYNDVNHITTEGMTAGVYVIRLTNGNDTKTQKIVVK